MTVGRIRRLRRIRQTGRGFSSPPGVQYAKKKPVLAYELFLKYGGEAGIDSLRSPCGQPVRCAHSLSNWLRRYSAHPWASPLRGQRRRCSKLLLAILCRTPVRASHPRQAVQYAKKKPVLAYELFFKYGGEAGIRTPDTLPYTHFPGVLLQPLGHLTILLFLCYRNGR